MYDVEVGSQIEKQQVFSLHFFGQLQIIHSLDLMLLLIVFQGDKSNSSSMSCIINLYLVTLEIVVDKSMKFEAKLQIRDSQALRGIIVDHG